MSTLQQNYLSFVKLIKVRCLEIRGLGRWDGHRQIDWCMLCYTHNTKWNFQMRISRRVQLRIHMKLAKACSGIFPMLWTITRSATRWRSWASTWTGWGTTATCASRAATTTPSSCSTPAAPCSAEMQSCSMPTGSGRTQKTAMAAPELRTARILRTSWRHLNILAAQWMMKLAQHNHHKYSSVLFQEQVDLIGSKSLKEDFRQQIDSL